MSTWRTHRTLHLSQQPISCTRTADRRAGTICSVAHLLDTLRIEYTSQAPFLVGDQEIILDFLLKSPRGIPVAIDCSLSRMDPEVLRKKAQQLDSRFGLIKTELCMGTVACFCPPATIALRDLLQELSKSLVHTDVLISSPESLKTAIIMAGEIVFEVLSNKLLRSEQIQGLPDNMEEVWIEEMENDIAFSLDSELCHPSRVRNTYDLQTFLQEKKTTN